MSHAAPRWVVPVCLLGVVLTGCGTGTDVGSQDLTSGLGDASGQDRPGAPEETSQPNGTPTATTPATPSSPAATPTPEATSAPSPAPSPSPAPAPTPTGARSPAASPAAVVFDVAINPDGTTAQQFEPRVARIYPGTVVRWTNDDTQPRSVVAADGSFASPELAPGATFEHRFDRVGTFNYSDGSRPYAQGTVEVVAP